MSSLSSSSSAKRTPVFGPSFTGGVIVIFGDEVDGICEAGRGGRGDVVGGLMDLAAGKLALLTVVASPVLAIRSGEGGGLDGAGRSKRQNITV